MTHSASRPSLAPAAQTLPVWTLLLFLIAAVLQWLPGAREFFEYDASAIRHGEIWRMATGHWTHFSPEHFAWDALVFLGLGAACERRDRRIFLACVFFSAIGISTALLIAMPAMASYRGLSGIDSALFMLVAAATLVRSVPERDWPLLAAALAFLAGFLFKTGYEFATRETIFLKDSAQMIPVPLAHLVGAAIGLGCGAIPFWRGIAFSGAVLLRRFGRALRRGEAPSIKRGLNVSESD